MTAKLYLSLLMAVAFALQTRLDLGAYIVALQRNLQTPKYLNVRRLNTVVRWAQKNPLKIVYRKFACHRVLESWSVIQTQASDAKKTSMGTRGCATRGTNVFRLGPKQGTTRHCHLLEFRGRSVLLDCGIHPGRSGLDALPFLDTVDLSTVDLLLVSHFHIDHAAGVPYLTEKTGFKGRIFMTHATRAVMRLLLSDYIRLLPSGDGRKQGGEGSGGRDGLYDEADLANCCDKVELVDFHQVVEHNGIRFWSYNAGHVLGAAMFYIEIGGVRLLYTGDYSMEEDRHLVPAEVPSLEPHVLIMESTYGTQKHESRDVREALFTSTIERIVQRGGRCLIPAFALGRAQELLLILDEYWKEREDLHRIPVFYASKMATRALRVYQTYINMMNQHVRDQCLETRGDGVFARPPRRRRRGRASVHASRRR